MAAYGLRELRKRGFERFDELAAREQRVNGLALVKQGKNLYILGKPGAGKTTFLKYIALQAAQHRVIHRVPIFVSLHEWASDGHATLLPAVVKPFALCHIPESEAFVLALLKSGKALVLFDGLDEVREEGEQRPRLTDLLRDFAREFRQCQSLITCRIAASHYAFEGFQDVEIADFTDEQVQSYVRKWFAVDAPKAASLLTELERPEHASLRELRTVPLLLSLLCLTFESNFGFPPNRAEIYKDAIEALLRKWDANRNIRRDTAYRTLSYERKLQLFAEIAAQAFEAGEYYFDEEWLTGRIVAFLRRLPGTPPEAVIDGYAVLKAIEAQHSIFVERAQGVYSFAHLTFQEYFTARYIVEHGARGTVEQLAAQHLTQRHWREVFLLTATLLADADALFAALRRAIGRLVVDEPALLHLLTWAARKAERAARPNERHTAVRLAYLGLALTLYLDRPHVLGRANSIIHDLILAFDLNHDVDLNYGFGPNYDYVLMHVTNRDGALAFSLALDRAPEHGESLVLFLDFALDLALDLANEIAPAVRVDYGLLYAWQIALLCGVWTASVLPHDQIATYAAGFADLRRLSQEVDAAALTTALAALTPPAVGAPPAAWLAFADHLRQLMAAGRDLTPLEALDEAQAETLNTYFVANELLVKCLQLAVLPDRAAILAGLFLPPGG